jgi:hypothetical protein
MTDQYRDPETAIPNGNDLTDSIRGLQAVVSRKENERQAALSAQADAEADAAAARRELADARALLDSERNPIMDPNRAPRRNNPVSTDPLVIYKDAGWSDFGMRTPTKR